MSKAIEGAALLGAAAAGLAVMTFATGGLGAAANTVLFAHLITALAIGGASMEAGAIAEALTSNRGQNITTRQPAASRQVIYGTQRVGGVIVYASTTGSHVDQYNRVIVLAGHEIAAIENLYLDGRQVHWNVGSGGNTTRNGVNFGGSAAGGNFSGPNGQLYNFGGLVYCEARFGDQAAGDVITGLTANDPVWSTTSAGSPSLLGCAYVYLKIEDDANQFPSQPEIRFTVRGKNKLYDPRTGTRGYSTNWALCVADVLTDTQFGLGLDYATWINNAQLVAAANVCDEQVPLAAGGTESRYALHFHYDTSLDPGSVLETMMPGVAGRLSFIGGQYYVWPAYWQGPSFEFGKANVTSELTWNPKRSFRDRFNRVNGTYIAPNYPYNTAGNYYDSNGFYDGTREDTFSFAFQPTNYPQYAKDPLHGYASDEYLTRDLGIFLPKELGQQTVLSIAQAQRVAKIYLERNAQEGSGSWGMGLECFEMQEMDVMHFTFPEMGWTEKVLEAQVPTISISGGGDGEAPALHLQYTFAETAASVYEWSASEELNPYDVPARPQGLSYTPAPPTNLTLTSGAATAVQTADGVIHPRIRLDWVTPMDKLTSQIQVMYALVSSPTAWIDNGPVDASLNTAYIAGVVAGVQYDVRIRGVRPNGGASAWVEIDGYAVSLTLSVVGIFSIAQNALVGEAFADGTAGILVEPFAAQVGNATVSVLPAGAFEIRGLVQQVLYYVYYFDPNFQGGAVTPIATQNTADFVNRPGYFLIGEIVTPYRSSSGASTRYAPSNFSDLGSYTTSSPAAAFDGNTATFATIGSRWRQSTVTGGDASITIGDGSWAGFPAVATTAGMTLYVTAAFSTAADGTGEILVNGATLVGFSDTTTTATYSYPLATGTVLNNLTVEATAQAGGGDGDGTAGVQAKSVLLKIYEIYVQ